MKNKKPIDKFFNNYPGWNISNITTGIKHDNNNVDYVVKSHPIIYIINQLLENKNKQLLNNSDLIDDFYYALNSFYVEKSIKIIQNCYIEQHKLF